MDTFFDPKVYNWYNGQQIENRSYICGYCGDRVSSNRGYRLGKHQDGSGEQVGGVYICPYCQGPTFFQIDGNRLPLPAIGNTVKSVPEALNKIYEEARKCTSQACFTGSVLLCRKMLMNIAVEKGEKKGKKFIEYVNYLSGKGYIPPDGKHWVDHIRKKGNEATHEIAIMEEQDAKELLTFTEMLLRFIYEFPNLVPNEETSD